MLFVLQKQEIAAVFFKKNYLSYLFGLLTESQDFNLQYQVYIIEVGVYKRSR